MPREGYEAEAGSRRHWREDEDEGGRRLSRGRSSYEEEGSRGSRWRARGEGDGGRISRSRYEEEDNGGSYGSRPRSRYDDEDERYGRSSSPGSSWRGSSRYESDDYERPRPRRPRYEDEDYGRGTRSRRGYAEDVGQGGWFGDPEEHSRIGRIGGEVGGRVRHQRAMQARHDLDEPDRNRNSREEGEWEDEGYYGRRR